MRCSFDYGNFVMYSKDELDPKVFVPQQFANPANPMIHRTQTAMEILRDVNGPIHGFCSGIGTGGIITDDEALGTSRLFAKKEGLMCGRSGPLVCCLFNQILL